MVSDAELLAAKETRTAAAGEVRYRQGVSAQVEMTTSSGLSRKVERSRTRAYPGLASPAPQTECIYDALAPLVRGMSVLDLGCGAGIGARRLGHDCREVTAVDNDEVAVDCTRHFAPQARARKLDAAEAHTLGPFDAVVCVDTLAQVASPIDVLHSIRKGLKKDGLALFAEPTAAPSQTLVAPTRRGFSRTLTGALFAAAGLTVTEWISDGFPFVIWSAVPAADDGWQWLADGLALSYAKPEEALSAFARAKGSRDAALEVEVALAEADLLLRLREGDAACEAFIRAKEIAPNDARPLAGLAIAMFDKGDTETALRLTKMAMTRDPTDVVARLTFASILERVYPDRAPAAWRMVNLLAPDNPGWAMKFALVAKGGPYAKDGILALDRLELYPERVSPDVLRTKADLLGSIGRHAEAALATRAAAASAA